MRALPYFYLVFRAQGTTLGMAQHAPVLGKVQKVQSHSHPTYYAIDHYR